MWITNDETLNGAAVFAIKQAILKRDKLKSEFMRRRVRVEEIAAVILMDLIPSRTPDGQRYTVKNLSLALKSLVP
jgi:hypothetical protein